MFELKNKTAVVTGAASGIGRATSLALARQGAYTCVADINGEAINETLNMIIREGGQGQAIQCDVTNQKDLEKKLGALSDVDILVNSAGISNIGTASSTSEEDFVRVFNVNVKGIYNCIHVIVPIMQKKGRGVIINMTSVANHVGIPDRFAYSMTKGAVDAMTKSVAKDFIKDGIRCNSVSPARVHTPFVDGYLKKDYPGREEEMFKKLEATQPIGRMARPEEIANLILYLASDEASFITGTDFAIDGGFINLNN